jgi:hypothetical protein
MFPAGVARLWVVMDPVSLILTIYSGGMAIVLLIFGATFLYDSLSHVKRAGQVRDIWEFFGSFGEQWWERFLPIQEQCTYLAWPGVDWGDEEAPLI